MKLYFLFFKPYGVLTQFTQDGSDKRTLAEFNFPPDVYPVGRLDYDSEGLIVLTDDGSLNKSLLDPQFGHDRAYLVQVETKPTPEQLEQLRDGVIIGVEKTMPADARIVESEPAIPTRPVPIRFRKNIPTAWLLLTLREGKNRQVRRMTAAVGCPTLRLVRVAIGRLDLFKTAIQPGERIRLTLQQVSMLFEKAERLEVPPRLS